MNYKTISNYFARFIVLQCSNHIPAFWGIFGRWFESLTIARRIFGRWLVLSSSGDSVIWKPYSVVLYVLLHASKREVETLDKNPWIGLVSRGKCEYNLVWPDLYRSITLSLQVRERESSWEEYHIQHKTWSPDLLFAQPRMTRKQTSFQGSLEAAILGHTMQCRAFVIILIPCLCVCVCGGGRGNSNRLSLSVPFLAPSRLHGNWIRLIKGLCAIGGLLSQRRIQSRLSCKKRQLPATCTHSRKGRARVVPNG